MPSKKMDYRKIEAGSPDRVNGKLVVYRKGDCISLLVDDRYLAAFITEKFNKYYDLTLIEYDKVEKPRIEDFINGKFFGRFGGDEAPNTIFLQRMMIECRKADKDENFEKVGRIGLIDTIGLSSYEYVKDVKQIHERYLYEYPKRKVNTANFEKKPDINFIGDRLITMETIIVPEDQPSISSNLG